MQTKPGSNIGFILLCALLACAPLYCHAQFNQGVQGTVMDSTGAVVPNATVTITNTQTQVTQTAKSDSSGGYRFVSMVPGPYRITTNAEGFSPTAINIELRAQQTLNVPITVQAAGMSQTVTVTTQSPVLNAAETRNELTLPNEALQTLPLAGRSMMSLILTAPGVTGSGAGGGSPGSGADNFSTETQVNASANGGGSVSNSFIVDGLDMTSVTRPGVANLTPNPDSIQEATVETNTYSVDYGRATSIQMVMTTKYGTDHFHGNIADYFTNQMFWAGTEFVHNYAPFHSNNISASLGGPIWRSKKFFFFGSVEPLLSLSSTGNSSTTVESPEFTQFAQQAFPNTLGTALLTKYGPTAATISSVAKTAQDIFPTTCGTPAAANLPCSTPVYSNAVFNASSYRNGLQWNVRLDKYFTNDRLYGNYYRTTLNEGGPTIRPGFAETNTYNTNSLQGNETHTFSPNTLNEAEFSYIRVEGTTPASGLFSVPVVNVTGLGTGIGDGFALGNFVQTNYHWRDVLTHLQGGHTLKIGYEGSFDIAGSTFAPTKDQPTFNFDNMLDLIQDNPHTETALAYDPLTGQPGQYNFSYAVTMQGIFAEDTWKARRNLTLNYGIRWDDYGNPYSRDPTIMANFHYGPGLDMGQQIANGIMTRQNKVFSKSMTNVLSPRFGVAWTVTKSNRLVVRGGFGIYHNWQTLGSTAEALRGNPPGPIIPTFFNDGSTPSTPIFALGTSNKPPFGFPYPALPSTQLDAKGGLVGSQAGVGGVQSDLLPPMAYQYSAAVQYGITHNLVGEVGYVGSQGSNLVVGGNQVSATGYGIDINRFSGDLIQNKNHLTRLNQSFGAITFASNMAESHYNAFIASMRGRFGKGAFFNASYTRSHSEDDAGVYPTAFGLTRYMGPSSWDVPNAFSFSGSYEIPGVNVSYAILRKLTAGWTLSDITSLQAGTPFLISTNARFQPIQASDGTVTGTKPGSGDYNADGVNNDWPNINSYKIPHSRQAYLNGVFSPTQYSVPGLGEEGNELNNRFRGPGFAESNLALAKTTAIHESVNFKFRCDFFNVFNRPNLTSMQGNLTSGKFGKATGQAQPRWIQFGADLTF